MKILEFFGVSGWGTLGAAVLFFVLLYGISRLPKKKFEFAVRVLIGGAAGAAYGLAAWFFSGGGERSLPAAEELKAWFELVGHGYVSLLKCLVLPMILIAGIRLVIKTPLNKTESSLDRWKKWVNTLMLAASALVSIVLGLIFQVGAVPGSGQEVFSWGGGEGMGFTEAVSWLIPSGIGSDMVLGNSVGIFVFAAFIGIAARRMSVKYMDTIKPFLDVTEACFMTGTSVCKAIIAYKPAGACAIMAGFTAAYGSDALIMLVKLLAVLCLASAVMLIIQLLLCALSGVGPAAFLKKGRKVMAKALKTRSGSACLKDAQEVLAEGLGLQREITDSVSSYAIQSGMQGCGALFPAMAAVFAAGLWGISMTPGLVFSLVVVIVLTSYGITGVPGTATMAEFSAVMGFGLGGAVFGLGPMVAIDPIGDVPRTLINVTGCMANAIIVERRVRE